MPLPRNELLKYGAASLAALALDYSLYIYALKLEFSYAVAGTLSFISGLIFIYFLSVFFIFKERRLDNLKLEFSIFATIGLIGLALTIGFLYISIECLMLDPDIARITAALPVFLFNFIARKNLIFKKRRPYRE